MTGPGRRASEDVIEEYRKNWVNEGFLSREHEELRKAAGERALRLFFRREEESGRRPAFLERPFRWQERGLRFSGRFDRIDFEEAGPVIIDFKTTEASSQKEADRAAADSLQMDVYALSFLKTEGMLPVETRLHFLESDIIGRAAKGQKELAPGGGEDPRGGRRHQSGRFQGPPGLAQLLDLRIQDDLPVIVRLLTYTMTGCPHATPILVRGARRLASST